jgi:hypothetical protein
MLTLEKIWVGYMVEPNMYEKFPLKHEPSTANQKFP